MYKLNYGFVDCYDFKSNVKPWFFVSSAYVLLVNFKSLKEMECKSFQLL